MIDDRRIVAVSDLHIHVPNLSYTPETFAGPKMVIRGAGDTTYGVIQRSISSPGVPFHINGIIASTAIDLITFYDVERIEVMRGPQGTLYGRNATAGAVNVVTRRPNFDASGGYVELELGDYDRRQLKGMLNVPIGDHFGLRLAGLSLERDGYINNKAAGEIPGVDDNLDDRDLYSFRVTGEWQPTDQMSVWLIYSRFKEDDSRVSVSNQVCSKSDLPTLGCKPDEFGLEGVHPGATFDQLIAGGAGAVPLGARDADTGLTFDYPRPRLGLRDQHTDVNPVFDHEEDAWLLGIEQSFKAFDVGLYGSYFETSGRRGGDYYADVGYRLNATAQNPGGLWPTSLPRVTAPCDLQSGDAGVAGGCMLNDDLDRTFAYREGSADDTTWSVEVRLRSNLSGRFNFLLGANHLDIERDLDFFEASNAMDILGQYGYPAVGNQQFYPSLRYIPVELETESQSVFGELYVDLTERVKVTVGLRYNDDEEQLSQTQALFSATNLNPGPNATLGPDPTWVRGDMTSYFGGMPNGYAVFLADRYGATEAIEAAQTFEEFIAALQIVPIAPVLGEVEDFLDISPRSTWDKTTGRIAIDWAVTDEALLYTSFSQGYRPGIAGFDGVNSELVDAYEIGAKTLWAGGSLGINGTLFFNDFDDLILFDRVPGARNVDAESLGFELEVTWRPRAVPALGLDFTYAWLDAEYKSARSIDQLNRTQNDTTLVLLKDPSIAFNAYTAPAADVLPLVDGAIAVGAARAAPGAIHENGVPVYFSRGYLEAFGVETSEGREISLDGNEMINSPPHSVSIGGSYTWTFSPGSLTLRYDYYWQDDSYGRHFNTPGDEIESWDVHNASLIFENADGRWDARAWIQNITDEDPVLGQFVQSDWLGAYRNYFLGRPRVYGATVRYHFGSFD
jgi:outer membrane receptor protein involved in Fe transport